MSSGPDGKEKLPMGMIAGLLKCTVGTNPKKCIGFVMGLSFQSSGPDGNEKYT